MRTTTNSPTIPFNWFGSVSVGRSWSTAAFVQRGSSRTSWSYASRCLLSAGTPAKHKQPHQITVLHRLAAANMTKLVSFHLEGTMAFTYRCLKERVRDRYNALMAIGLLSEKDIQTYLPTILQTLKNCLPQRVSPTKQEIHNLAP